MALGGAMGVAWWDVIGYHTVYPQHFPFLRYCMQPVSVQHSAYPVLNAPESACAY